MINVRRTRRTVLGFGVLLVTAALAALSVWRNQASSAASPESQYRAAADALAQLKRDWNRNIEDLARTNKLIAWKEARIEEAAEITADLKREPAGAESRSLDEDVVQLCEVCITEENIDLAHACRRRAQLAEEKSQLEQEIAAHEAALRQLVAAADQKEKSILQSTTRRAAAQRF